MWCRLVRPGSKGSEEGAYGDSGDGDMSAPRTLQGHHCGQTWHISNFPLRGTPSILLARPLPIPIPLLIDVLRGS